MNANPFYKASLPALSVCLLLNLPLTYKSGLRWSLSLGSGLIYSMLMLFHKLFNEAFSGLLSRRLFYMFRGSMGAESKIGKVS